MVNKEFYKNAKIYKIIDNTNSNIYIGSTCKKLCQRLSQHREKYKAYLKNIYRFTTSFEIIKNGDYNIVLLEELKECDNIEQLRARERYYIETLCCVNKRIPLRTITERVNSQKLYRVNNKEQSKHYYREYTLKNKVIYKCNCCNVEMNLRSKATHEKSKKHLLYMQI
jgi:hypothetical protein